MLLQKEYLEVKSVYNLLYLLSVFFFTTPYTLLIDNGSTSSPPHPPSTKLHNKPSAGLEVTGLADILKLINLTN